MVCIEIIPKSLIVNELFTYLSISDILMLRLINKRWKSNLDDLLTQLQRNYAQLLDSEDDQNICENLKLRILEEFECVKNGIDHISKYSLNEIMAYVKPPSIILLGLGITYMIINNQLNNPDWRVIVKWLLCNPELRNQFKNYKLEIMPEELYEVCNTYIDIDKSKKFSIAIYQLTSWSKAVIFLNKCYRENKRLCAFVETVKIKNRIQREIKVLRRISPT